MIKKNYAPGIHGPKRKPRQSEYCLQLREKQKTKRLYNVLEKQFKLTFDKGRKQKGDVGENLLRLLETRFDNTVYRLGFADSRNQARQFINHGHFTINGKKVDIPSYQVRTGDIIAIKKSSKDNKIFKNLSNKLKKAEIKGWLNLDIAEFSGKVLHAPKKDDLETKINTPMIVEFYSK